MKLITIIFITVGLLALSIGDVDAQTNKNKTDKPPVQKEIIVAAPTPASKVLAPSKKNERPGNDTQIKPQKEGAIHTDSQSTYFYEFTRPGFSYGKVQIDHNDKGKGKISFLKDGYDDLITDPIELSPVTLAKIVEILSELNFIESAEEYQHPRDYTHLGNMSFTLRRDDRSRTVKYNWTENKSAKALMDEYRRITNEYTWKFEILIARQNLPLQTPSLMDMIDSYVKRHEISDPANLLTFLNELSNDERLPLIARNRAVKLVKEIEKLK